MVCLEKQISLYVVYLIVWHGLSIYIYGGNLYRLCSSYINRKGDIASDSRYIKKNVSKYGCFLAWKRMFCMAGQQDSFSSQVEHTFTGSMAAAEMWWRKERRCRTSNPGVSCCLREDERRLAWNTHVFPVVQKRQEGNVHVLLDSRFYTSRTSKYVCVSTQRHKKWL